MAKKKEDSHNYPQSLSELSKMKSELEMLELFHIEKALTSNDPRAYIEAKTHIKNIEEKKKTDLRSFSFSPDGDYYTGQGYRYKPMGLSNDLLRNMSNTPQIKAIINTRIEQASNFNKFSLDMQKPGWTIKRKSGLFEEKDKELTNQDKRTIEAVYQFMENGGKLGQWDFDGWETFTRKLYEDSWGLDQGVFEVAVDRIGRPSSFDVYDGGTFYLAEHRHKTEEERRQLEAFMINGYLPRYVQVIKNKVQREYYPWELCFGVRNANSSIKLNGYGLSENEVLIQIITWMLNANSYNGNFFQQGSNPKGILNFKDNVNPTKLEEFKQAWSNTLSGYKNSHKLAAISGGNLEWLNMQLCLHGDTRIVTKKNGSKSLVDILNGENEIFTEIWDGVTFSKARVFKTQEKIETSLTLSDRTSIKSSFNHKFLTLRDNDVVWVERKDLVVGDYIFVNKKPIDGEQNILSYKGKKVESDIFETLGWITGDGHIGDNKNSKRMIKLFYHPEKESSILDRHLAIFEKYSINAKRFIQKRSSEYIKQQKDKYGVNVNYTEFPYIAVVDSDFFNWFISLGFKTSKEGKEIPEFLYSYDSDSKCSFMRGFYSADGHISEDGWRIDITISNPVLKEQFRDLLFTEGIRCTSFKLKKTINSSFGTYSEDNVLLLKDRELFFDKIGFIQDYKNDRRLKRQRSKYNVNEAPIEFVRDLALKIRFFNKTLSVDKKLNKKDLHDVLNISKGHQKASLSKVLFYADKIGFEIPYFIKDFRMEQVIELTETDEMVQMYDVEMFNKEHQFCANGMIVHNSNRDMEFHKWSEFLTVLACTVFRIDPDEVGFHLEGSKGMFGQDGQKERLQHSKEKGLEPFMKFWQKKFTKYLVGPLTDGKFEFQFTGLEPDDEEAQLKRDIDILSNAGMSVQDFFMKYSDRELDKEKDMLLNQIALQYKQMEQMGSPESNEAVDEMAGDDADTQNPFEQFEDKSEKGDPFNKALNGYLDNFLKDNHK